MAENRVCTSEPDKPGSDTPSLSLRRRRIYKEGKSKKPEKLENIKHGHPQIYFTEHPSAGNHSSYVSSVPCTLLPKPLQTDCYAGGKSSLKDLSGSLLAPDNLFSAVQSRNYILMFQEVKMLKHPMQLLKGCVLWDCCKRPRQAIVKATSPLQQRFKNACSDSERCICGKRILVFTVSLFFLYIYRW